MTVLPGVVVIRARTSRGLRQAAAKVPIICVTGEVNRLIVAASPMENKVKRVGFFSPMYRDKVRSVPVNTTSTGAHL